MKDFHFYDFLNINLKYSVSTCTKALKKQLIKKIKTNCTAIFQYNRIFIKAHIIDLIKIKACTKPIFNLSNSTILINEPIRNPYTDLKPLMFCYFLNNLFNFEKQLI